MLVCLHMYCLYIVVLVVLLLASAAELHGCTIDMLVGVHAQCACSNPAKMSQRH